MLGRASVALPRLGLGTAQLGNLFREMSGEQADQVVEAAWEAGVRYYDTAPHYGLGLAERRLGQALQGRPRREFVVSTKVGRLLEPSPQTADQQDDQGFAVPADARRVWDFSADGVRRSLESSLDRLGLDRLDIALLHDPDEHWEAASSSGIGELIRLREEGVVDAIGVGMNQAGMPARFIRQHDIDVVMLAGRYTLLDRSGLDELLPLAAERGVAVIAAGVYNSGLLSEAEPSGGSTYDYLPAQPQTVRRAKVLAEICASHGVELPAAAIQFPLRHKAVSTVVVGAQSAEQVRVNAARLAAPTPEALWEELGGHA